MWKSKKLMHKTISSRKTECIIYEHFRATGAHDAALDLSDLFDVSSQGDDTHDFHTG